MIIIENKVAELNESCYIVDNEVMNNVYALVSGYPKAKAIVKKAIGSADIFKSLVALNKESVAKRYNEPESKDVFKKEPVTTNLIDQLDSLNELAYQCSEVEDPVLTKLLDALYDIKKMPVAKLLTK